MVRLPPGAVAALLLSPVAGCVAPAPAPLGPSDLLAGVAFPPMTAALSAAPEEASPGHVQVAWNGSVFGASSPRPEDFPTRVVRAGATLYVTAALQGWTSYDVTDGARGGLPAQIVALDVRGLLADAGMRVTRRDAGGLTTFEARGTPAGLTGIGPFHVAAKASGGVLVSATVDAPGVFETPYVFAPGPALPFEPAIPPGALPAAQVEADDWAAAQAHGQVVLWLEDYARDHAGALPEHVTPQSLQRERTASGRPWPTNPFTHQPLAEGAGHGDFAWQRCAPTRARYEGLGWDGSLYGQSWGPSCPSGAS